jgi:hypothetical protein
MNTTEKPISALSDEQLVRQHFHAWRHWVLARTKYGELGTPDNGKVLEQYELEAKKRGISDEVLMALVREWEQQRSKWVNPEALYDALNVFWKEHRLHANTIRMHPATSRWLRAEYGDDLTSGIAPLYAVENVTAKYVYSIFGRPVVECYDVPEGEARVSYEVVVQRG